MKKGVFILKEVTNLRSRIEAAGMFGGHVPSRGALDVVQRARSMGIDPSPYVQATVERTEANGRHKVIIKPDNPLGTLRNAVMSRQAAGR